MNVKSGVDFFLEKMEFSAEQQITNDNW